MAEGKETMDMNDEEWLYGGRQTLGAEGDAGEDKMEEGDEPPHAAEVDKDGAGDKEEQRMGKSSDDNGEGYESDVEEEEDSDDGVQVVIKPGGSSQSSFIGGSSSMTSKQGPAVGGATSAVSSPSGSMKRSLPPPDKKTIKGNETFSVEDFEGQGTINGVPTLDFSIDSIPDKDKGWRKPGADVTDYFNYSFNEATWRAYTENQKRMRSAAGCLPIPMSVPRAPNKQPEQRGINVAFGGPPPKPRQSLQKQLQNQHQQRIDMMRRRDANSLNNIQVMTADRRLYSQNKRNYIEAPPTMQPLFNYNPAVPPPMSFAPTSFPPSRAGFMSPPPGYPYIPPQQFYSDDLPGYEGQDWMNNGNETWDLGGMPKPAPGLTLPPPQVTRPHPQMTLASPQMMHGALPIGTRMVHVPKLYSNVPPPSGDEKKD